MELWIILIEDFPILFQKYRYHRLLLNQMLAQLAEISTSKLMISQPLFFLQCLNDIKSLLLDVAKTEQHTTIVKCTNFFLTLDVEGNIIEN